MEYDEKVQKILDIISSRPLRDLTPTEVTLARAQLNGQPLSVQEVAVAIQRIQQERGGQ